MAAISKVESGIVSISGEIDMHESPRLKQTFEPLIVQKKGRVLVDFSGVSYIDSSGLAVFIEAMQRIQAYGGKFGLFGLRENVRNIFELSRLDQVFQIYPDKSAALNAA